LDLKSVLLMEQVLVDLEHMSVRRLVLVMVMKLELVLAMLTEQVLVDLEHMSVC
jgi:hypothetical protein